MLLLQQRIAEILSLIPEIKGVTIICEDKSDLIGRIITEINKNTALLVVVSSARGTEADSADGLGMFTETIRVSFFASMLAKDKKALLPIVESAIRTLHEAPIDPRDGSTEPVFRVTGHESGGTPEGIEGHTVMVDALWAFASQN